MGKFHETDKTRKLCQLRKSGSRETPGSNKSVNLIWILGSVVEGLILDTITEEFKDNIFHASPHDFAENRFCQTNVMLFFDGITSFINKNSCVDIIKFPIRHKVCLQDIPIKIENTLQSSVSISKVDHN